MFVADLIENEGELLDRRDDDLLAGLDEPSQVAGTLGVSHRRAHLGVFPDRVSDLPVEDAAVGDDDDRVEDRSVVLFQPDQLVGQPSDRKALAAARRVLDQVTLPRPAGSRVGQELAHRVDLVIARPDLDSPLLPRLGVLRFHDLGVVLQDVGQAPAGQHLAPQVVDRRPLGLGGFPAPSFQPRLKGRNQEAFPLRWVQKWTSFSSTAKWAAQRPNSKSFSRG